MDLSNKQIREILMKTAYQFKLRPQSYKRKFKIEISTDGSLGTIYHPNGEFTRCMNSEIKPYLEKDHYVIRRKTTYMNSIEYLLEYVDHKDNKAYIHSKKIYEYLNRLK